MALDAISVGDVTEDVFIQSDDFHIDCEKNHCILKMDFSTKIAASKVDKLMGGNAGNFAIGSARLGLKSALFAEVGDDLAGKTILQSLQKDKVSTRYFKLKKNGETNYSVVLNKGAERTIIVYHVPRTYNLGSPEKAKVLYLTSAGKGSEHYYKDAIAYKKKNKCFLGFNPGTHQMKLGLASLKPMFSVSDVVSINVEEAQFIFNEKSRNIRLLLEKLKAAGTKIALITDGPAGSYTFDGNEYYYCPIYDVPIVERTGCGDSFTTGFMCSLFYGNSIPEAMRWGTVNAASVISFVGPQAGLLKSNVLKQVLNANQKFQSRKFDGSWVKTATKYNPVKFKKFP